MKTNLVPVVSLSKNVYIVHCSVLVGSKIGSIHDLVIRNSSTTIKIKFIIYDQSHFLDLFDILSSFMYFHVNVQLMYKPTTFVTCRCLCLSYDSIA